MPASAEDWIRIDPKHSFSCLVEVQLAQLGITHPGRFTIAGYWEGNSPTVQSTDAAHFDLSMTHAPIIELTVAKTAPRGAGQGPPPTLGPGEALPTCGPAPFL